MEKGEIINLDECVLNALEFFNDQKLAKINAKFKNFIVIGSGNAETVGRILFEKEGAIFANESNYSEKLKIYPKINEAVLISASGGKHAPEIAKKLQKNKIKTTLFTNNMDAKAKKYVSETYYFPKILEPYTYNTSTYFSMILSKTGEDTKKIKNFLQKLEQFDFKGMNSFYIILPEYFESIKAMLQTKFDELFGPKICARIFTYEQTKHAKTVVGSDSEMFIGLGFQNKVFGKNRVNIKVPKKFGTLGHLALGYYLIGKIQAQNEPYFKENIEEYVKNASKLFGERIEVIS
jgi:hypothetical protein